MNRWRQRLAEIDGGGTLMRTLHDVQNVQNVQNSRPSRHFVQIEQIEQREDSVPPSSATLDSSTPDNWSGPIRELISRPCPDGCAPQRWASACQGVQKFTRGWAARAVSLGWTFDELFAVVEPFANVSLQGATWSVGDSTVTAVTADAITLRTYGGATQRIYRKAPTVKRLQL